MSATHQILSLFSRVSPSIGLERTGKRNSRSVLHLRNKKKKNRHTFIIDTHTHTHTHTSIWHTGKSLPVSVYDREVRCWLLQKQRQISNSRSSIVRVVFKNVREKERGRWGYVIRRRENRVNFPKPPDIWKRDLGRKKETKKTKQGTERLR